MYRIINWQDKLIGQAAAAGSKLVALPENFALMGDTGLEKIAEREADRVGPIQDFLAMVAKKYSVWVVAGSVPMEADADNKIRAACLVYNDTGERVARYDKIHLFDVDLPNVGEVYRESDTIEAGQDSVIIDTPFGRIGLIICYDLRFPELIRSMSRKGVDILIVPAAFTAETGAAHWEVLLRARAIENLLYVIAPNQGGFHVNGRKTFGHSMIVDPWGVVMDCYKTGGGFVSADIDLDRQKKLKASFPVLEHRRLFCE